VEARKKNYASPDNVSSKWWTGLLLKQVRFMNELKVKIELNPELVKEYYYSRDIYKEQIRYLDKKNLYIGCALLCISFLLACSSFEKFLYLILVAFIWGLYLLWKHLKIMYLRSRWLKTIEINASHYNGISSAELIINESGVGLHCGDNSEFLYWGSIKQFDLIENKFYLIYSSEPGHLLIPLKGLSQDTITEINNYLVAKEILKRQKETK
jgi:hypothetical protein